ncbi:hypothetical protein BV25DRAFT_1808905 [Artomyces pyxidatus]|uniref:Uncharacterized protein n=1 Tax=Artomyces pyxidatus TaxID=48021 RepID=A0ACB8SSF3_9AGAM|nr:hypothetical protein BV25DRAFT_1808905 [Artomyces pyxidatus]
MEVILARIREQEASEALARQLQEEWNAADEQPRSRDLSNEAEGHSDASIIDLESSDHENHKPGPSRHRPPTPETGEPPDSRLADSRDLFTGDKTCPSCSSSLPSPRGFMTFSATSPPPSLITLLHVPCKKCKKNHCRGCLACTVATCCANVRAIALFQILGGFDREYLSEKESSDVRAREAAARNAKLASSSVGPGGTGYGTGARTAQPVPRGGGRGRGRAKGKGKGSGHGLSDVGETGEGLAAHWDAVFVRALENITAFLPAPYADAAQVYDLLPHAAVPHMLALSQLPELLGALLRNDSVADWVARGEIYYAMLALLRRLADCELTVGMLVDRQWEKRKTCGLETWMWEDGEVEWEENGGAPARAPPLFAHFRKLTRQCEAFLAGASQLMDDGDDDGDVAIKATSLCGDMIAARENIERAMKILGMDVKESGDDPSPPAPSSPQKNGKRRGKGKGRDPAVDMERAYSRECEKLAFKHVMLGRPGADDTGMRYLHYNYEQMLSQTASATRNPKNRFHLVKELAVMATSLPPGVWVRVDEVRNDAIKIMIAGPDATPYEGGLFEFDCFMPLEYPNTPPLVHLRTTGGGTVRFNPNLYSNGKVCLSLLGTWPGQPGFGKVNTKDDRSIEYNKAICLQTVNWAMVDWMKDNHKDGLWGDVIASHFRIRGAAIRSTIESWAKTQPDIRSYHPHGRNSSGVDLLAEYDLGIQRLAEWEKASE